MLLSKYSVEYLFLFPLIQKRNSCSRNTTGMVENTFLMAHGVVTCCTLLCSMHHLAALLTVYVLVVCFQVVLLQEAKGNLLAEVERLNDRLSQSEALDDPR